MAELFKQALVEDRPSFIDFLLRINYDPRQTFDLLEQGNANKQQKCSHYFEEDLSKSTSKEMFIEFQNHLKLGERGLDFVFQLYKEVLDSNAQVSRLNTAFTQESMYHVRLKIASDPWLPRKKYYLITVHGLL